MRSLFGGTRRAETDAPDIAQPAAMQPKLLEFIGYAQDCVVSGSVAFDGARLTDLLNELDQFELVEAHVEGLAGDRTMHLPEIAIARDELLLIHAVGPRGEAARRIKTSRHALGLQVGPFAVRGYLHALPGVDPLSSFRHRRDLVPLTDAWISYQQGSVHQGRRVETVLVNRHHVDSVVVAHGDHVDMPHLPLPVPAPAAT